MDNNNLIDKIKIIPINKGYEKHAKALVLNGLSERFGYLDKDLNTDLNNIIKSYTGKGNIFLIGLLDKRVACTGALIQLDKETAQIVRISVDNQYRKNGFAKLMIKHLEKYAFEKNFKRIIIFAEPHWTEAVNLYNSCGYVVNGQDDVDLHFYKNIR